MASFLSKAEFTHTPSDGRRCPTEKTSPNARFLSYSTAPPHYATKRACFVGVPRSGRFVFLQACPFGNICGAGVIEKFPKDPLSPSLPFSRANSLTLIRALLMEGVVTARLEAGSAEGRCLTGSRRRAAGLA